MKTQVTDLVTMRDAESLFEIMNQDDDWMLQLDAAEGLVELGDRRGLEFLLAALDTEIPEMNAVAQEILDTPKVKQMVLDLDAEEEKKHKVRLEAARTRIQKGARLFRYKVAYLPSASLVQEAIFSDGVDIPELNDLGLEGWEVVNFIPRSRTANGNAENRFAGVYLLLKKQLSSEDVADLDEM